MKKALRNVAIASAVIAAPVVVASQAGAENATGIGTFNVGPAYIADNGISTLFELVNTDAASQTVHVSLRSRGDSADLWDRTFTLTSMDVLILQIYDDNGIRKVKVVNGSDSLHPAAHEQTGYEEPLSGADGSACHFDDTVGYIVACDWVTEAPEHPGADSVWMGNTWIMAGSGVTVAINNAAADDTNPQTPIVDGYLKNRVYADYGYNATTLILTHPTFCPDTGEALWGCGFYEAEAVYFTLYDYDEKKVQVSSPYRVPAEELSVIAFSDVNPNAVPESTAFYTINGKKPNKGLGFNISQASFSSGIATVDLTVGLPVGAPDPRNTVCSYLTFTNGDVYWLPCQYTTP